MGDDAAENKQNGENNQYNRDRQSQSALFCASWCGNRCERCYRVQRLCWLQGLCWNLIYLNGSLYGC